MALRDKFITTGGEKNSVLLCSSTHHLLEAKHHLSSSGVEIELVPAPSGIGSACTTAIRFVRAKEDLVRKLLEDSSIEWTGIYPIEKKDRIDTWDGLWQLNLGSEFERILQKVAQDQVLSKEEIIILLQAQRSDELTALFKAASKIRAEMLGATVDLRAAIEFSNYCIKGCNYCGLRSKQQINRYRMSKQEIISAVAEINQLGIETVILQSGEDPWYTTDKIIEIIQEIKDKFGMKITLSLGERSKQEYKKFKEAGADNYLLKLEAANRKLFKQLHPDDQFKVRREHTKWLKELGYITGSGNIVGLPGQKIEDLAADILFYKEYGIHMIGIGPFLPAKGTPYQNHPPGDLLLSLKTIAVTRLVCQNVYIPSTTALASLAEDGLTRGLEVGANVIMLIMTPTILREKYQIYSGKNMVGLKTAISSIKKAGREVPGYIKQGI
ncbi:[FeFe] hydrogenase H-cluster radical SAM maturase HydE [Natroniella sulfidigena]|uniref:[FeFe] hydrogenase H-cluster radical SAM maturase HydE n=1 Tax=Natroniella sulfidigena TaxID=723921 RepID=UPI00200A4CB9|nr:[FeFe] hydrogenase H-cluster radical SAM maturase HydE [Natroniella sulfidigena]MCK8816630.1 [FeFe] hydrogenase H-cluster radical SAM maturase HydE [Natroniella sulfidigena]